MTCTIFQYILHSKVLKFSIFERGSKSITDIREQLFYGEYKADRGPSAYREQMDKGDRLWSRVYETMGKADGDKLWENMCALLRVDSLDCFKEGVYLGTLLMLELFYTPQQ